MLRQFELDLNVEQTIFLEIIIICYTTSVKNGMQTFTCPCLSFIDHAMQSYHMRYIDEFF
jgi:hypothetical protein